MPVLVIAFLLIYPRNFLVVGFFPKFGIINFTQYNIDKIRQYAIPDGVVHTQYSMDLIGIRQDELNCFTITEFEPEQNGVDGTIFSGNKSRNHQDRSKQFITLQVSPFCSKPCKPYNTFIRHRSITKQ